MQSQVYRGVRSSLPAPIAGLLGLFIVSGCLAGSPDVDGKPGTPLPALGDFAQCRWTYPDGSPVPCQNQAPEGTFAADPPASWLCVFTSPGYEVGPPAYAIFKDPLGSGFGLKLKTRTDEPVGGVLHLQGAGSEQFFSWPAPTRDGFVRFSGTLPARGDLLVLVHETSYALNATLAPGTWRQLWSWHGDDFWVIHSYDAAGETYSFYQIQETRTGRDWSLGSFKVHGGDFELVILVDKVLYGGGTGVDFTSVNLDC